MGIDPCDDENHEIFNTTSQKRTFVDARTGLFEVYVPLPTLSCNRGLGPAIDMSLFYTPMVNNRAGLGDGWSFAFTTYNEDNGMLRLHSGEAVNVEKGKSLAQLSIIASWSHEGSLTVRRPNGRVEVLWRVGESSIYAPVRISDDGENFAHITWAQARHEVNGRAYSQKKLVDIYDDVGAAFGHVEYEEVKDEQVVQISVNSVVYQLNVKEFALVQVSLPHGEHYDFTYDDHPECGWLLSKLVTPDGLSETVEYKDNGLPFEHDPKLSKLPCVAKHTVKPAHGATEVATTYKYSQASRDIIEEDAFRQVKRHITLHKQTHDMALRSLWMEMSEYEEYNDWERWYALKRKSHLRQLEEMDVPLVLRSPYCTTVDCAGRIEEISYGSDHQVLRTVAYLRSDESRKLTTRNSFDQNVIRVERFASKDGEERLQDKSVTFYENQLMVKRETLQGVVEWSYTADSHKIVTSSGEGALFDLALLKSEKTTYSDGSSLLGTFGYDAMNKRHSRQGLRYTRPVKREQSLFDSPDKLKQTFKYGDRGLEETVTTQPNGITRKKSTTYIGHAFTTVTTDHIQGNEVSTRQVHNPFTGQLVSETDVDGNTSEFEYDLQGRLVGHVTCAGNEEFMALTRYSYPAAGRMEVIEPNGLRRAFEYDGRGNVVHEYLAPPVRKNEQTVPWKLMRKETFDDQGRRRATERFDYLPLASGEQIVSERRDYEYDAWGNEAVTRLSTGEVLVNCFDPVKNMRIERQGELSDLHGKFTYYHDDETVRKIEWRDAVGAVQKLEGFVYCRDGLIARHVIIELETRHNIDYRYDSAGRCIQAAHAYYQVGARVDLESELEQALKPATRYSRKPVSTRVDSYEFSKDLTVSEPVRVEVGYHLLGERTFDDAGRVTSISRNGFKETYSYQGSSTVPASKTSADGKTLNYTYYKELGNRIASVSETASGLKQTFSYATPSTPVSEASEGERSVRSTHDEQGNVSSYEARLKQQLAAAQGKQAAAAGKTITYQRSAAGRLIGETDAGGGKTELAYDEHGRRLRMEHLHAGGAERSRLEYVYDAAGRLAGESLSIGQPVRGGANAAFKHTLALRCEYDQEHRETSRTFTTPQGSFLVTRAYDAAGRLVDTQIKQDGKLLGRRSLGYDLYGNLQTCETSGVWRPSTVKGEPIDTQTFSHDDRGNVVKCVTSFGGNSCTSDFIYDGTLLKRVKHSHASMGASGELTYDAAGRVTKDQNGKTYQYDALGRLTKSGSRHYAYDALSRLMASGEGADQNQIIYDDLTVRGEYGAKADDMRHCCLDGTGLSVTSVVRSGVRRLLVQLKDLAGTVVLTCDLTAETFAHHAYTAYGSHCSTEQEALEGFNGEYRDASNDQYPLGNGYRWYAPELMRFPSPDSESPFGKGGPNAYAYCDGDPVNRQDPTGHLGIFAALAVVVGAFFITYAAERVASLAIGEKAASVLTTGIWAGIGVLTAIATGGLSLWVYAAIVGLSLVAFGTAVASAVTSDTDPKASEILGWISLSTTIAAGVVGTAGKVASVVAKGMRKLSTKLGGRSGKPLAHLLRSTRGRAARYRPTVDVQLRSEISMEELMRPRGSIANLENLMADMGHPFVKPQSTWRDIVDIVSVFDSSDANTLICTTTGLMGMTNVFESEELSKVNGQLNNETWLPWGNWKGFSKVFSRRG